MPCRAVFADRSDIVSFTPEQCLFAAPVFCVRAWLPVWQMNSRGLKEGKTALPCKLAFFDMYMNVFFRREDAGEAEWDIRRQSRDSGGIVL